MAISEATLSSFMPFVISHYNAHNAPFQYITNALFSRHSVFSIQLAGKICHFKSICSVQYVHTHLFTATPFLHCHLLVMSTKATYTHCHIFSYSTFFPAHITSGTCSLHFLNHENVHFFFFNNITHMISPYGAFVW